MFVNLTAFPLSEKVNLIMKNFRRICGFKLLAVLTSPLLAPVDIMAEEPTKLETKPEAVAAWLRSNSLSDVGQLANGRVKQFEPPEGYKPVAVKLQTLKDKPKGVQLNFAILPGQWKGAEQWSSWGDAICASDGNFYCSLGDHASKHGHVFLVKVDPKSRTSNVVVDLTKEAGPLDKTRYAPGMVQGPLVEHKGWLYFSGYPGAEKYTKHEFGYDGDSLMRYNITTGQVENLGKPVKDCSYPVYQVIERKNKLLLYGMTTPGLELGGKAKSPGVFFVYDIQGKNLIFQGQEDLKPAHARAFITTSDGRAYYSANSGGKSKMVKYDPATNKLSLLNAELPGDGSMRAASRVDSKGVAYGITPDSGAVFAFDTKTETVKPIGDVFVWTPDEALIAKKGSMYGYTAVAKLDPTERFLYVVPRSFKGADGFGCPVVRIDVQTGKKETVCQVLDAVRQETSLIPLGSFGSALSADGKQLLIVWNSCDPTWKNGGVKFSFADDRWALPILDIVTVTLLQLP